MPNPHKLALQSIVGQLNFRPNISTYRAVPAAAEAIEGEFKDWVVNKSEDIVMLSEEKEKLVQLRYDLIRYVNESNNPTSFDVASTDIPEYFNKIIKKFSEECGTTEIRRLGIRSIQIFKSSFEFKDLVELIHTKFYTQNTTVRQLSAEKVRDVVFILEGHTNNFDNKIHIGPVKKEQIPNFYKPNFEPRTTFTSNDNLYIDIDVSISDIDVLQIDKLPVLIKEAIEEISRIRNGYLDYINS